MDFGDTDAKAEPLLNMGIPVVLLESLLFIGVVAMTDCCRDAGDTFNMASKFQSDEAEAEADALTLDVAASP